MQGSSDGASCHVGKGYRFTVEVHWQERLLVRELAMGRTAIGRTAWRVSKELNNVFAWSYEEMPGIDPRIVEHERKTYDNTKPVRQKLRPVHPKKSAAIKVEV